MGRQETLGRVQALMQRARQQKLEQQAQMWRESQGAR
jgi:hypothetical protein